MPDSDEINRRVWAILRGGGTIQEQIRRMEELNRELRADTLAMMEADSINALARAQAARDAARAMLRAAEAAPDRSGRTATKDGFLEYLRDLQASR